MSSPTSGGAAVSGVPSTFTARSSAASKVMSLSGSREPTLPTLNGAGDLQLWRRKVKAALRARQLWTVVLEKTDGPENDAAAGVLISTLSPSVLHLVTSDDYASEIWNEVLELFAKDSAPRMVATYCRLANLRITSSEDLPKALSRFREMVAQNASAGGSLDATHQACILLNSLSSSYPDVYAHFTLAGEEPTVDKVITATLALYESKKTIKTTTSAASGNSKSETALAADGPSSSAKKFCKYCKHVGHDIDECRKLQKKRDNDGSSQEANVVSLAKTKLDDTIDLYSDAPPTATWLVDSGATSHMASRLRGQVSHLRDTFVTLGDGRKVRAESIGKESFPLSPNSDVLVVPSLKQNLFSLPQFILQGGEAHFSKRASYLEQDGIQTALKFSGNRFELDSSENSKTFEANSASVSPAEMWHDRLGHLTSPAIVKEFGALSSTCEHCIVGKMTRKSYSGSPETRERIVGRKFHSDLCGPLPIGYDGSRYILTLVEDSTRAKYVFTLKEKSQAAGLLESHFENVERRLG